MTEEANSSRILQAVARVEGRVEELSKYIHKHNENCNGDREVLSTRLRSVERKQSWIVGVASAAAAGIGIVWGVLKEGFK